MLQEIYYFKPQAIYVSIVFMTVIAYALGEAWALLPRKGALLTFLNPFPFNSKEHAFIIIMASAAATNAVSTEILAAQRLYYNMDPSPGAAIFLVISSQLLGFGIAGLLRSVLVQPTRYESQQALERLTKNLSECCGPSTSLSSVCLRLFTEISARHASD